MPTIITHGIVALAASAKTRAFDRLGRARVLAACALCAMLPDLDYVGFKLGVQYNSLFGHRGFTHSVFFAALVALPVTWLLRRAQGRDAAAFGKLFLLLFAVTVSHPLLDAFTDGGEGIAFFSPFSNHRYFFPYRPVMVAPLGVTAFFHLRGMLVLLDELLLVILPVALVLYLPDARRLARARKVAAIAALAAWAAGLSALKGLYPLNNVSMMIHGSPLPVIELFTKQYRNPRVLEYIPTAGIPENKLVTSFDTFQRLGLYNRRLESRDLAKHWASGFFSNWFGGIAGRWQDPDYQLVLRTLVGFRVPDSRDILDVLKEAANDPAKKEFLFRLSPTEKYDLALGDYDFTATRSLLNLGHNATELPKFWFGICNGMAAASQWYDEPFRSVEVVNPNGFRLEFHPNDVKALLGFAMAEVSQWASLGNSCAVNGPAADSCRINPGAFFLATMNRLGLAHEAFIVDGFASARKQFYLFDAVRVEVLEAPEEPRWPVPTIVKRVAKVRFTMDFVSTLLADKAGGEPDAQEGKFKKVGRVVVPRTLEAMIALDGGGNVVGGGWVGEEEVPDVIFFPNSFPATDEQGRLRANPALNWLAVRRIYEQSISPRPTPVDFSL